MLCFKGIERFSGVAAEVEFLQTVWASWVCSSPLDDLF
jgi:hypothetical protein